MWFERLSIHDLYSFSNTLQSTRIWTIFPNKRILYPCNFILLTHFPLPYYFSYLIPLPTLLSFSLSFSLSPFLSLFLSSLSVPLFFFLSFFLLPPISLLSSILCRPSLAQFFSLCPGFRLIEWYDRFSRPLLTHVLVVSSALFTVIPALRVFRPRHSPY